MPLEAPVTTARFEGGVLMGSESSKTRGEVRTPRGALQLLPLLCGAFVLLGLWLPLGWDSGLMQPWHDGLAAWLGGPPSPETDRLQVLLWPWNTGLADHLFDGEITAQATRVQLLLSGAVGGTVFAHFLLLRGAHRAAPRAPWVRAAVATSIAAWAVPDAATSIDHGAWYNLVYIDLPTVLGMAVVVGRLPGRSRRSP